MDWLKRMNDAMDLIENRMEERINIEEIAKAADSSPFHFQRMFSMFTGITVAEYVRKRKLTLAAQELAITSSKVVDVALKYGYESPESFAKAFRKIHGITPSEARDPGVSLKAFPRITFQISVKGDKEVVYRIEEKAAFTVAGKSARLTCEPGSRLPFLRKCHQEGTIAKLRSMSNGGNLLGITMDINEDQDFTYIVATKTDILPEGLKLTVIPACTWAIFTSVGPLPNAILNVFSQIFQEWFPAAGYEHSGGPELEVYLPGDSTADDYRCEVWIPIVKVRGCGA